jgi:hypothetical protein
MHHIGRPIECVQLFQWTFPDIALCISSPSSQLLTQSKKLIIIGRDELGSGGTVSDMYRRLPGFVSSSSPSNLSLRPFMECDHAGRGTVSHTICFCACALWTLLQFPVSTVSFSAIYVNESESVSRGSSLMLTPSPAPAFQASCCLLQARKTPTSRRGLLCPLTRAFGVDLSGRRIFINCDCAFLFLTFLSLKQRRYIHIYIYLVDLLRRCSCEVRGFKPPGTISLDFASSSHPPQPCTHCQAHPSLNDWSHRILIIVVPADAYGHNVTVSRHPLFY